MTLGIGIVGYGFMGRTHAQSWLEARRMGIDCELRAISARRQENAAGGTGNIATGADAVHLPPHVALFDDAESVINNDEIDVVSICTPTDTHVELACAALRNGKHVLLEKPVALSVEAMRPLLDEASRSSALCMPAHCMRFWPGWPFAREAVADERYGRLLRATFRRVGPKPGWKREFYGDDRRSGGALFDLHIHDADFVLWCFGEPQNVRCSGTTRHVHATYEYDDYAVNTEGAWIDDDAVALEMKYRLTFEHGELDFSFDRSPPLQLVRGSSIETVPVEAVSAYTAQAVHLAEAVIQRRTSLRVTLADAHAVTELLQREARLLT
jgi:predicted dehydrogenase